MQIAARHQNNCSSYHRFPPEHWKLQQEVTKGNNPPEKRQHEKPECQRQFAAKCRGGRTFGSREREAALEKPAGALGIQAVVICSSADLPL